MKTTFSDHLSIFAPPLKQQNHNKSNEKTNPHVEGQRLKNNICINNNYIYNITFFITMKNFVLIILINLMLLSKLKLIVYLGDFQSP